jgi:hypothetical protein
MILRYSDHELRVDFFPPSYLAGIMRIATSPCSRCLILLLSFRREQSGGPRPGFWPMSSISRSAQVKSSGWIAALLNTVLFFFALLCQICKTYLYANEAPRVLAQFRRHVARFRELSSGWGIGDETFEFWAWLTKQSVRGCHCSRRDWLTYLHLDIASLPT